MKRAPVRLLLAALTMLFAGLGQSKAGITTYGTRAAFDVAAPGVPVEGFQNADTSSTGAFTGPLNSSSNIPGFFSPGDILPGITLSTQSNNMFTAGPGQSSNPTLAVGSNFPGSDSLELVFGPGVTALAFDLFQNFGGGSQSGSNQTYQVSLYDTSDVLIGTYNATVPSGSAGFFGATSDSALIGRASILGPNNAFEVVDNIAFGQANAEAVPEPASIAMLLVGTMGVAGYGWRRRKQSVPA
ncbi:MAG: PEP-CTERM sorting domain-containing protein [Gemmataceae bacterium]